MSKNSKIIIGVIGGILVVILCACIGVWIFLQTTGKVIQETVMVDNPAEASALARSMIDYDLPPAYKEEMAINFLFMKMVMIAKDSAEANNPSQTVIMIAEMPFSDEVDEEQMRLQIQSQMKQTMQRQAWNVEFVGEKEITIRGQDVTLLFYEGVDETGEKVKQVVSSLFEGKNGQVMIWIAGSESGWDQSAIDYFVRSIR